MRHAFRSITRVLWASLLLAPVVLPPAKAGAVEIVAFRDGGYRPGSIVIKNSERRLYFVLGGGRAERYPVGVGKTGKRWTGYKQIVRKMYKPDWAPPPEVKRDIPSLPNLIRGGTAANPMGVAALIMTGNDTAIHGTNRPGSVGGFVSYGCIRMYNRDIARLFAEVSVGTPVYVLP